MKTQFPALYLVVMTLLAAGCTIVPKRHPGDGSVVAYPEVVEFMEAAMEEKGVHAYGRLWYLRSEQDYHIMKGTVSPKPIQFTLLGVDEYLFRVRNSDGVSGIIQSFSGQGAGTVLIGVFWGSEWKAKFEAMKSDDHIKSVMKEIEAKRKKSENEN